MLTAFVAYPISGADEPDGVRAAAQALRLELARRGWRVRPEAITDGDAAIERARRGEGRSVVQNNVEGISTSSVLVLLIDEATKLSSVWVEAGVALARGVPTVVVASERAALPFLVASAVGSSRTGLPSWHRITVDLARATEEQRDALAHVVAEEITSGQACRRPRRERHPRSLNVKRQRR